MHQRHPPKPTLFDAISTSRSIPLDGNPDTTGIPSDMIQQHGLPYMARYYLLGTKMAGGSSMRYHHILASDTADLHDHPWDFVSVILSGTYTETTPDNEHTYGPGSVLIRKAEQLHRLTLVDGPVWTIVTLGPPRRKWGYMTPRGWQHWSDYQSTPC